MLGDVFGSRTTDLMHSPQLEEAAADNLTNVFLHSQLSVEVDAMDASNSSEER